MELIPSEAAAGGKLATALKQFFPQGLLLTRETLELRLGAGGNSFQPAKKQRSDGLTRLPRHGFSGLKSRVVDIEGELFHASIVTARRNLGNSRLGSRLPVHARHVYFLHVLSSRPAQSLRAAAGPGLLARGSRDAGLWGDVDGVGAWAGGGDGGDRADAGVHWR
jgi:hypothetical protein